jgi:hypothetical protein
VFTAFVMESVTPAQQVGEHVLILRRFSFNTGVCSSRCSLSHLSDSLRVKLSQLSTYGPLSSSLLSLFLMNLVARIVQQRHGREGERVVTEESVSRYDH